MHPTSNFMGHYLIAPLAARGITCLGLNSRYAGNDTVLLMERVLQDLGAGVKFMRETLGCERVVLVGNSGGAALAAYYQAEAERFTAETMVDGDADAHRRRRPAADRRHRPLRRARGSLAPAAALARSVAGRRARRAVARSGARHVRAGELARRRRAAGRRSRPSSWLASAPRSGSGATASRRASSRAWPSCARRRERRATRRSSSTAPTPIRAASTSRSTPTTARRAASGAMRAPSTTPPTRWAG